MISLKALFWETRPHYLLLSVVLVYLGASLAGYYGTFNWPASLACLAGLVLLHVSANVLNDYYDYASGIDLETVRTPFNGGSGSLNLGLLTPRQVLLFGLVSFALAVPIGGYFVATVGWNLLPLFLLGAVFVIFNSSHITRLGYGLGELSAGLGLGALPVFGSAWIISGSLEKEFICASVPSAIWVFNLLLLNEFPDVKADERGGRRTLPIQLGFGAAQRLYVILSASAFLWITSLTLIGLMPAQCLIVFLSLPLACKAREFSGKPEFGGDFVKAQAANVALALSGHFLLATGYLLASA